MATAELEQGYAGSGGNGALSIDRYFSKEGVSPFDRVEWGTYDVDIKDEQGAVIFKQKDSLFPTAYSPIARSVIASRYAYGDIETEERETSYKDLIGRVTETYGERAVDHGYFDEAQARMFTDELTELTLNQMFAFNSPVWFNVGTHRYQSRINSQKSDGYHIEDEIAVPNEIGKSHLYPQTSACFIQYVDDTMEDIMNLATKEAMLFKYGSGTGTDLSTLRSSFEKLSGGGQPSGPLAYLRIFDSVAHIVKSGGKTRRAAKMNSLKDRHPDIKEFITSKRDEERKAKSLMESGYSAREASSTVAFQNANISVRLSDEFMDAVKNDDDWYTMPVHNHEIADRMPKYKARDLMHLIAECAWECGDPGVQFDTIINDWHTSPNNGRINASNPCSEYMFLDDTSCNLASANLMKFRNKEGGINIESLERAITTFTTAMDLNLQFSSFPSETIAQKSFDNRTIGLGYANLGSLLMSEGIPYDSDEGRAVASAISALTAGSVYETSTHLAEKLGTFKNFDNNKEEMMRVMSKHRKAVDDIDVEKLPEKFRPVLERAREVWDTVLDRGEQYGFRNAQGTVIAPTGTIGLMMDCDTTGIEPELMLIKYKNLAEGGLLKIVNGTVPSALEKLGYEKEQINTIEDYINEHETIEGAPHVKEEHLPVFDTSFEPTEGSRSISWQGHVKMMAAVQPFISGAISKTVNMPADSTPQDIQEAYTLSWDLGLKSLAIYRDGSKAWQALDGGKKLEAKISPESAERVKLHHTRYGPTHKFTLQNQDVYLNVGEYGDGRPGELFINMAKEGSTMSGVMDGFATAISIGLQHGVPLKSYVNKMIGANFEPNGWVQEGDRENIKMTKSMLDYMGRWLQNQYPKEFPIDESSDKIDEGSNGTEISQLNFNGDNNGNNNSQLRGPKTNKFCVNCGNDSATYILGGCAVLCDNNFGGCGHMSKEGCGEGL